MTRQTLNEHGAREFPVARLADSKNPFVRTHSAIGSSVKEKAADRCCDNILVSRATKAGVSETIPGKSFFWGLGQKKIECRSNLKFTDKISSNAQITTKIE